MERQLIFLPVSRADAASLVQGVAFDPPRRAFAATGALLAALGYQPNKDEEAEYAALVLASVWSLARFGERLVVVAEVPEDRVLAAADDDVELDNGAVLVNGLPLGSVIAWFADGPEAGADVAEAVRVSSGLGIDEAWDRPEVQAVVTGHEMLWHAADELHLLRDDNRA